MASLFNNPQSRISPQVQRFGEIPDQLACESNQRYRESPMPSLSPDTSTGPPIDEYARRFRQLEARRRSTPSCQFLNQWSREEKELFKPFWKKMRNLPFDRTLDLQGNAQNNVRSRWVEQGIWKSEWGPAWPKGTEPSDLRTWPLPKGPAPYGGWGHEEEPKREPTPEPQLARSPEDNCTPFGLFGYVLREQLKAKQSATDSKRDITEEPATAPERDTSASRPYHQFLYQVSKECGWIEDELQHQGSAGSVDIKAKAYENVKKIWIEDQIWNFKWGELPGMTWMHEEPYEEVEAPNGLAAGSAGKLRFGAADCGKRRLRYRRDAFGLELSNDVGDDPTDSSYLPSTPRGVEASS
jgi:hypothetical protein